MYTQNPITRSPDHDCNSDALQKLQLLNRVSTVYFKFSLLLYQKNDLNLFYSNNKRGDWR